MQNKLRKDFLGKSSKHALKRALPSMSNQPLCNNIKQATLSNKQPPPLYFTFFKNSRDARWMCQSAFKSLMRMIIIENDEDDIPDFLNMSTKISVCKVCKEATVNLLLTTVLSNQKHQYCLHLNLDDVLFSHLEIIETALLKWHIWFVWKDYVHHNELSISYTIA